MTKPQTRTITGASRRTVFYLSLIGVLCAVCFYPVTKYYFAQDDFILLANAVFERHETIGATVGGDSDLFRPLTKIFYFQAAHSAFGMNAYPYHVVSILLHVLNTVLVFLLLRRFRIDRLSSVVVSALFAFHAAFFDVLAWISCVQQLAGQAFMLAGLLLGIRAMATKSRPALLLAVACYALALLSLEQTYALAPALFLYALSREKAASPAARAGKALRETAPYLVVMLLYLVYMAAVKGIPAEGPYRFHFGSNVASNLLTYLDWAFAISVAMPFFVDISPSGLTAAHLVLALVILYNLAKGRKRIVVFGSAYYLLAILPVLFLKGHTFYLHNYVPAVGIVLMVAPVVEDFFEALRRGNAKLVPAAAVLVVGLAAAICFTKVRENETSYVRPDLPIPKNFVLRRAVVARNLRDEIAARTAGRHPHRVYLMYGGPNDWYMDNVVAALGRGDALRLFFSDPALRVSFHEKGERLEGYDPEDSVLFFFDYMGRLMTPEEANRK